MRQVATGYDKKTWWECDLGHEWQSTVANQTKGQGCPVCGHIRDGEIRRKRKNAK